MSGTCCLKKGITRNLRDNFTQDSDDEEKTEKQVDIMLIDKGNILGMECLKKSINNPFPRYEFSLFVRIFN